ncbi:MAG: MOSC domain-containing protein [Polyangiales bacterium]
MEERGLQSLLSARRAPGRVAWIGVRAERGATMRTLTEATLIARHGVEGDYTTLGRGGGKRQVTLLQAEHLDVIAKLVERERVGPEELRRNLMVEGINLHALRLRTFRIGSTLLEGTGYCEPCSKMERAFGVGGYNAVRGHGGILARVLEGGVIRVGDEVDFALERS